MGNCQAIDTATIVIQHPNGKLEMLYSPVPASHVINSNPHHYLALLISSTTLCNNNNNNKNNNNNPVRLTRIKLLKPTDTLVLGQIYRLISAQEVMKGLWAKKQAKMKKNLSSADHHKEEMDKSGQENKLPERHGSRTTTSSSSTANNKSRTSWQPALHSISEASS